MPVISKFYGIVIKIYFMQKKCCYFQKSSPVAGQLTAEPPFPNDYLFPPGTKRAWSVQASNR